MSHLSDCPIGQQSESGEGGCTRKQVYNSPGFPYQNTSWPNLFLYPRRPPRRFCRLLLVPPCNSPSRRLQCRSCAAAEVGTDVGCGYRSSPVSETVTQAVAESDIAPPPVLRRGTTLLWRSQQLC